MRRFRSTCGDGMRPISRVVEPEFPQHAIKLCPQVLRAMALPTWKPAIEVAAEFIPVLTMVDSMVPNELSFHFLVFKSRQTSLFRATGAQTGGKSRRRSLVPWRKLFHSQHVHHIVERLFIRYDAWFWFDRMRRKHFAGGRIRLLRIE